MYLVVLIIIVGLFETCLMEITTMDSLSQSEAESAVLIDVPIANIQLDDSDNGESECYRTCVAGVKPKICHYIWEMEQYHAMGPACGNCSLGNISDCYHPQCVTGDGTERGVMSINRRIPGPALHVCTNDIITVDIVNKMSGSSSTIHWHGFHQRKTPHMDGVPFVTQCPIIGGNTFRYTYRATESGTQFYHSHTGHHKPNGHYGGIVVREPISAEPNAHHYDFDLPEHLIVTSDWMLDMAEMYVPGLPTRSPGLDPTNILINGRGKGTDNSGNPTATPLAVFRVQRGNRYRFRLVNSASMTCLLQIQIEDHKLTIISTDSYSTRPLTIDTLVTGSGERYDFVINANGTETNYWIRIKATGTCENINPPIEQYAILTYSKEDELSIQRLSQSYHPIVTPSRLNNLGIILNYPNATCYQPDDEFICSAELQSYPSSVTPLIKVDQRFVLAFDSYFVSNDFVYSHKGNYLNVVRDIHVIGAINSLSFIYPTFPILTQRTQITPATFCDEKVRPVNCTGLQFCHCVHRIKVKLNTVVELIIVDETRRIRTLAHPFHLHGYGMQVVGMGRHPYGSPSNQTDNGSYPPVDKKYMMPIDHIPPIKDTVMIPSRGFIVLRFRADNPGFWLMHCHFEWHLGVGMGLIFQVGETSQMVRSPTDMPRCGNYAPRIAETLV